MTAPKVNPGILDIVPYKGGEAKVEGVAKVHKLSSNESPLGPSPKAMEAYRALGSQLHIYPEGGSTDLRTALARHHGLDADRIICSNGSDELIALIAQAYCAPGDEVVYSQHGFLMYPIATKARGGKAITAPETDLTASVDAMLAAVTPKTRIVFLANPNNPTGTYLPDYEVKRLRDNLPADVLLVIDAAYAEYVGRNDYTSGFELVHDRDNTLVTRTFSKAFGLAGLRVGWAYGPKEIIDVLHRVRGPFNVNLVAQTVAVAALEDVDWLDAARRHNDVWLPKVSAAIDALGYKAVPSVGNFVLIRFPGGVSQANAADAHLRSRGLILRAMGGYGLPDCLRLTIGTEAENTAVLAALREFAGK